MWRNVKTTCILWTSSNAYRTWTRSSQYSDAYGEITNPHGSYQGDKISYRFKSCHTHIHFLMTTNLLCLTLTIVSPNIAQLQTHGAQGGKDYWIQTSTNNIQWNSWFPYRNQDLVVQVNITDMPQEYFRIKVQE